MFIWHWFISFNINICHPMIRKTLWRGIAIVLGLMWSRKGEFMSIPPQHYPSRLHSCKLNATLRRDHSVDLCPIPDSEYRVHHPWYEQRSPNNERISNSPFVVTGTNLRFPSSGPSQPNFPHTCVSKVPNLWSLLSYVLKFQKNYPIS